MDEGAQFFSEGTEPGTAAREELGRYGERTAGGGVSFRCATCGEAAAVIRLADAGTAVNMGPPFGEQRHLRDGVVIDYWLGGTCWRTVDAATLARINAVLATVRPDPAALHAIDWELVPFWCRTCQRCYCRSDWRTTVVSDGPFYDWTEGVCPAGHRQMIDG